MKVFTYSIANLAPRSLEVYIADSHNLGYKNLVIKI